MVAAATFAGAFASVATAQTPAPPAKTQPNRFDTPVNAKPAPVKQTKSCSIYGDGFVYVPGADTCVRIGGSVRSQVTR
jgi:hypothetical protein